MGFLMSYLIGLGVGRGCNFRCKYCFEQYEETPYENLAMSKEVLDLACKYIRHERENLPSYAKVHVPFFGGEPLLYLDNIDFVIKNLVDTDISMGPVTNGSLIMKNCDAFKYWHNIIGDRLLVNVSYDYSEQEKTRQAGSYETVRNSIRFLAENRIKTCTITVVSASNIDKLPEILSDFMKLQEECPYLIGKLNVNMNTFLNLSWENDVYPQLKEVEKIAPQVGNFVINPSTGIHGITLPGNIWRTEHAGIDVDGTIYTDYTVFFASDVIKNALYLGSVYDDFDTLDAYRKELISSFSYYNDIEDKCSYCPGRCRYAPWDYIKGNINEARDMPPDVICKLYKFLHEYF